MIADGKHEATLFDANFCVTNAGSPAISFVWETTDGERLSYVLCLTDSTGRRNHFGIQVTRRWATAWDGSDLTWFRVNREALLGTRALLSVRDGHIEWVTPSAKSKCEVEERNLAADQHNENGDHHRQPQPSTSTSSRSIRIKLIVDPAKLSEMPERIEPTFEEARALFDILTEGTDKLDADKVWTLMAKKIGPLQIDFGDAEWQQMIDKIKQLKSWEGVVS